jgi:hypothetical protein
MLFDRRFPSSIAVQLLSLVRLRQMLGGFGVYHNDFWLILTGELVDVSGVVFEVNEYDTYSSQSCHKLFWQGLKYGGCTRLLQTSWLISFR